MVAKLFQTIYQIKKTMVTLSAQPKEIYHLLSRELKSQW